MPGHLGQQLPAVEAPVLGHLLEERMALEEPGPRQHVAHEADREQRLDPAGAAGDDADRARRGDRVDRGVAQLAIVSGVDRLLEIREDAPFAGQFLGRGQGLPVNEPHQLGRERHGLAAGRTGFPAG